MDIDDGTFTQALQTTIFQSTITVDKLPDEIHRIALHRCL